MKNQELIVVGLAGLAVYMIVQSQKPATTRAADTGKPVDFVSEIFDALGRPFKNGWRYYDNGVAIAPNGDYYQGGQLVWRAPK